MSAWGAPVRRLEGVAPNAIPFDDLIARQQPVVLAGLARGWPMVERGLAGSDHAADYLKTVGGENVVTVFTGPPEIGGRFHYNDTLTGFNFNSARAQLAETLDRILLTNGDPAEPSIYIGSTDLDRFLPSFRAQNDLTLDHTDFAFQPPLASIWIGNRTTAAAHYDMSNNLACCLVGQRRFTLFPPAEVGNLYPGPLEPTPGGQVVTMVDLREPDLARYPRFAQAMAAAQIADLEPGDVLFYPALWWHQVDALAPFNVMVNYWWNPVPAHIDSPQNALLHALLSLRDRPDSEKQAWRALFEYYVFGPSAAAGEHLPPEARGPLGAMDEMTARRLRAQLLKRLNR